jgi:predicted nucleic acid-binding protein
LPSIVSNSSPIINLAVIGRLELLKKFWGRIIIPEAVYQEIVIDGGDRAEVQEIKNANWIVVEAITDRNLVLALSQKLDKGESEAIALAIEKKADLILLDETDAREVADMYDLKKTGVLGILTRAKVENEIESLKEEISLLQEKANFWLRESLIKNVLEKVGESL